VQNVGVISPELLTLSRTDQKAIVEILCRQRNRRALRLYPEGRTDPLDDGVTPFAMSIKNNMVTIDVGRADKTVLMPRDRIGI